MRGISPEIQQRVNEAATRIRNIDAALALGCFAVATEASFAEAVTRGCLEFTFITCLAQGTKELTDPEI